MNRRHFALVLGAAGAFVVTDFAGAQQKPSARTVPVATTTASKAVTALEQAAAENKFTFIVFSKDDSPAVKAMAQAATNGVAKRSDRATLTFANVNNPADAALVTRFDVGRAPMPLTLAVAPNGAITGMFPRELKDENIDASLVTPTMTKCMKSLQENKLVFVCVQTNGSPAVIPAAVKELQADAHFKDRVTTAIMQVRDPNEAMFVSQMQLDPALVKGPMIVVLAPPGLLVGKYEAATATKSQLAVAISDAGKCCDDPNCVHNQAAKAQQQTVKQPTTRTTVPVKKGN